MQTVRVMPTPVAPQYRSPRNNQPSGETSASWASARSLEIVLLSSHLARLWVQNGHMFGRLHSKLPNKYDSRLLSRVASAEALARRDNQHPWMVAVSRMVRRLAWSQGQAQQAGVSPGDILEVVSIPTTIWPQSLWDCSRLRRVLLFGAACPLNVGARAAETFSLIFTWRTSLVLALVLTHISCAFRSYFRRWISLALVFLSLIFIWRAFLCLRLCVCPWFSLDAHLWCWPSCWRSSLVLSARISVAGFRLRLCFYLWFLFGAHFCACACVFVPDFHLTHISGAGPRVEAHLLCFPLVFPSLDFACACVFISVFYLARISVLALVCMPLVFAWRISLVLALTLCVYHLFSLGAYLLCLR